MIGSTQRFGVPMGAGGPGFKGNFDPAKMQARMDRHFEALKTQLKLTAAQDGAWTAFKAAMQPSADMLTRHTQRDDVVHLDLRRGGRPTDEGDDSTGVGVVPRLTRKPLPAVPLEGALPVPTVQAADVKPDM